MEKHHQAVGVVAVIRGGNEMINVALYPRKANLPARNDCEELRPSARLELLRVMRLSEPPEEGVPPPTGKLGGSSGVVPLWG